MIIITQEHNDFPAPSGLLDRPVRISRKLPETPLISPDELGPHNIMGAIKSTLIP